MSKFLKFLVNLFLICSIIVTASLLIPPLAGVTTNIIDTVNMDTNLPFGSVTYSKDVTASELAEGDKVLVDNGNSIYVYTVQSGDASTGEFTVLDAMDKSSEASHVKLRNPVFKVILTVPFTGYIVVAMQSVEGFIIIILVLVFVAILFILSELWKKGDEDDDDEEEEEEEEHRETRRERKARLKAEKEAARLAKEEAKNAAKAQAEPEQAPASVAESGEKAAGRRDYTEVADENAIPAVEENVIQNSGDDFSELPEDDVKIYTPRRAAGLATAEAGTALAGAYEGTTAAAEAQEFAEEPLETLKAEEAAPTWIEVETPAQQETAAETAESAAEAVQAVKQQEAYEAWTPSEETRAEAEAESVTAPRAEAAEEIKAAAVTETAAEEPKAAFASAAAEKKEAAGTEAEERYETPSKEMAAAEALKAAGPVYMDPQAAGLVPDTMPPQDPEHFTPVDRPTLEEIVEQARKRGLNPDIRRDSITNVNLVDFSDLL